MEQFVLRSCIRGCHIYKDARTSSIGKMLDCECEAANHHNPYAVATNFTYVVLLEPHLL